MIESWGTTQELTGCREKQVALAGCAAQVAVTDDNSESYTVKGLRDAS